MLLMARDCLLLPRLINVVLTAQRQTVSKAVCVREVACDPALPAMQHVTGQRQQEIY